MAEFTPKVGEFMRELTARDILGDSRGANPADRQALADFLNASVYVHRDAAPVVGRFPILLYHPSAEGPFQEDAVLFEFLASHGYVVLSSAYQSPDPAILGNNASLSTSLEDLQSLVRYSSSLEFVDIQRIGAIGFSMGAQILLQWIGTADCPVDAAILLDTTLEYTPEEFPLHRIIRDALKNLNPPSIPILLAASATRDPNFSTFDEYLMNSPRYEVQVQTKGHGDFVADGVLHYEFHIQSEGERQTAIESRRAYENLANVTLRFLNRTFQGERDELASNSMPEGVAVHFRPPDPNRR